MATPFKPHPQAGKASQPYPTRPGIRHVVPDDYQLKKSSVAPPKKYPDELRARAVRLYRESDPKPVIRRLAEQLGVHHEALRNWIRQDEADRGERDDRPTGTESEELRRLRKENAELSAPTKF
ncbi:transposase [Saccharothrix saharensis]|uniref:Transposase n=1 Tax=Saccharothrix saharensis TaxID=571190 RepID=A0A543J602_9PSEU|nr:transposase [Saccharothrix saharensis]TQM78212.1 transposase [Saccharothrix saharensis]